MLSLELDQRRRRGAAAREPSPTGPRWCEALGRRGLPSACREIVNGTSTLVARAPRVARDRLRAQPKDVVARAERASQRPAAGQPERVAARQQVVQARRARRGACPPPSKLDVEHAAPARWSARPRRPRRDPTRKATTAGAASRRRERPIGEVRPARGGSGSARVRAEADRPRHADRRAIPAARRRTRRPRRPASGAGRRGDERDVARRRPARSVRFAGAAEKASSGARPAVAGDPEADVERAAWRGSAP